MVWSITTFFNLSLAEGQFPDAFRIAHVTPLLKKSLERNELSNIRPASEFKLCFQIDRKNRRQPN